MVSRRSNGRLNVCRLALTFIILLAFPWAETASAQGSPCLQGWAFDDLTASSGGPPIVGTPASLSWNQSGVGKRTDVWARGSEGGLVHYVRIGSGLFVGETLPTPPEAGTLRSDPVAVLGWQLVNGVTYSRQDVFVTNQSEELLHYWWSEIPPRRWSSENLTQRHGGPSVFTQPVARNSYYSTAGGSSIRLHQDVYSVNLSGDLVHYSWESIPGWRHKNVRSDASGGRLNAFVQPTVVDMDPTTGSSAPAYHHIFAPDLSGHLSYYWRDPARGARWNWRNLSQVGGVQVHPRLSGYPLTVLDVNGTLGGANRARFSVFGFFGSNALRYWSWNLAQPWSSENVTVASLFVGVSQPLVGRPAVERSNQFAPNDPLQVAVRHDLWARDQASHLIHYWSWDPWSSFKTSGGVIPWQPGEDLTNKVAGPLVGSDPLESIQYPLPTQFQDPNHYVFGRNGSDLVSYCWDRMAGWDADVVQSISSPFGDPIAADPTLDDTPGFGLTLFAQSPGGHLLRFWKMP